MNIRREVIVRERYGKGELLRQLPFVLAILAFLFKRYMHVAFVFAMRPLFLSCGRIAQFLDCAACDRP